jgi:putative sigma-54 modulation protein
MTMSVQITSRNVDLQDQTRRRIEAKAGKLSRYFDRIHEVDVVLTQERHRQIAEVVLHCEGVKVKAREANTLLLTALDRAFEKVERQIKRYKRRLIDTRRRPARRTMRATETVMALSTETEVKEETAEARDNGRIIDTEHRELLGLTPDEAAMHLDLSGDPFLVFLNVENHHINVIYNRPDGHCGLIEPVVD